MSDAQLIRPVILAGGLGTRLWPVSRASYPKQFVSLVGEETLFQQAVRRVTGEGFARPIVVTAEPFRFVVLEQLEDVGVTAEVVLIEPEPRNTAPAVAAAVAWINRNNREGAVLVTPSDHAIDDLQAFQTTVHDAVLAARQSIVTFGIAPTHAETGYGWLELDANADATSDQPLPLAAFVEKPDTARAEVMLAAGQYLWNAGIFLAEVGVFTRAFSQYAPEILTAAETAVASGHSDLGFFRLQPDAWTQVQSISLDHAVMEKAQGLKVQPWRGGWSDLGGWDAVARLGQAHKGAVTEVNCDGSYLSADDGIQLVGIGLKDMIAVAMPDAVLVAHRSASQEVGRVVKTMKEARVPQATEFPKEHRPWGWFETLVLGERFRVKRIVVKPGGRLSLQSHKRRAEHWVVVEGTVYVTVGNKRRRLSENQSLYVPVEAQHRLENEGDEAAVLIEVQTGGYLGEDDIVRYDDVYARD